MKELQKKQLLKINMQVHEVLEEVIDKSGTYVDAKDNLKELKISAKSHFKTEHLAIVYEKALKELEEKINATLIKK
ncbi:transcriptional regulator [Staphylococcus parequorum]|uniref:transcriptional regulator n=1 Tax=Staphylococcus sp. S9 TaxID=3135640 RepID=UPI003368D96A